MRQFRFVIPLFAFLASLVLTPAAQAQETRGSVRIGIANGAEVARRSWLASSGAVNGITGHVFALDVDTIGGSFSLEATRNGVGARNVRIDFYDDIVTGGLCAHYEYMATDLSGEPCGRHAIVSFSAGTDASFVYTASPQTPDPEPTPTSTPTPDPEPTSSSTPTPTPTVTPTPPTTGGDQAVAYQVNALHDGSQSGDGLSLPLISRWTRDLGGEMSYPLIAGGRVFVTVRNNTAYGTKLWALDRDTGQPEWGPVDLGGTYYWSGLAYHDGLVFTVNFDGLLVAFDEATGVPQWSRDLPGQYAFTSPPTAANGVVFVGGAGSGGTLYAVDQSNGALLWTAGVANGDHSSPAVTEEGVYVSYACQQVYDFEPATGDLIWHHATGCSGGGGRTPVLHDGRLWSRDSGNSNLIIDADTGTALGNFSATAAPAFDGSRGFFLSGKTLEARNAATNAVLWTYALSEVVTAPIVAGDVVFVGSSDGCVHALGQLSGAEEWSDCTGSTMDGPDEHNVSQPLTGMNAGEGYLVVPAGTTLIAYD